MSVPRPAMFVATVTAPLRPAWATIVASRSCCLALSTSCWMPRLLSCCERYSDFSTEVVPTRIGWPLLVLLLDVVDDRLELGDLGAVDQVGLVLADHRPVGRDRDDAELVDLVELGGLGHGRTGHAADRAVLAVWSWRL